MKISTKDKIAGSAKVAKGKTKVAAGKLVGSTRLKAKGYADQVAGKMQKKAGDRERARGQ